MVDRIVINFLVLADLFHSDPILILLCFCMIVLAFYVCLSNYLSDCRLRKLQMKLQAVVSVLDGLNRDKSEKKA